MTSFPSESQLVAALIRGDELVRRCAAGELSLSEFFAAYDNLYWSFPLDGHESDPAGLAVLAKYSDRVAPHRAIAETILAKVAADAHAGSDSYREDGRIGTTEALARLKLVAAELPGGEA